MSTSPIIGITIDFETAQTYSHYPWYALRRTYVDAITHFGGVPILLPHESGAVDHYLSLINGLVVTGGNFDIPPEYYGEAVKSETVHVKSGRSQFEFKMLERALAADLPIFGICGGFQLLNVITGGTLIQHIPDEVPNALPHEQKNPKHEPSHCVEVLPDTKLYDITKTNNFMVNSTHHQAIKKLGKDLVVSAIAPDNVIEAIELPKAKFVLGVEWHPDYLTTKQDHLLYAAFIDACC